MNHQEVWKLETATSQKEQLWLAFVKCVEKKLGHSLDGDQFKEGYSLDYAYDHFLWGFKCSEYVKLIQKQKAQLAFKETIKQPI